MRFLSVVGARPQFIKIAPMCRAIAEYNKNSKQKIEDIIVHTGQHYDPGMSDIFFEELKIPKADYHLGVGSCGHGAQTGRMLEKLEALLLDVKPSIVIVYGDTNSTLAAALAAVKLLIPVIHVEAGLRSFNKAMPEEINRIVTDHISSLLLAPTPTAMENLKNENLLSKSLNVGDIMRDAVIFNSNLAKTKSALLSEMELVSKNYGLVTMHRAENTDNLKRLNNVLNSLNRIAESGMRLIFPLHPRTKNVINEKLPKWKPCKNLFIIEPVGYLDMMELVRNANLVFTDSGGLQKEAFFLNCPCITLREETEWVETVELGGNILAGSDPERIHTAYLQWKESIQHGIDFSEKANSVFGKGNTADKILNSIIKYIH